MKFFLTLLFSATVLFVTSCGRSERKQLVETQATQQPQKPAEMPLDKEVEMEISSFTSDDTISYYRNYFCECDSLESSKDPKMMALFGTRSGKTHRLVVVVKNPILGTIEQYTLTEENVRFLPGSGKDLLKQQGADSEKNFKAMEELIDSTLQRVRLNQKDFSFVFKRHYRDGRGEGWLLYKGIKPIMIKATRQEYYYQRLFVTNELVKN